LRIKSNFAGNLWQAKDGFTQNPLMVYEPAFMANGSLHTCSKITIADNHNNPAYLNQF